MCASAAVAMGWAQYVDEEGDLVTLTEEDDFRRVVMDMRKDNKVCRTVVGSASWWRYSLAASSSRS